MGSVPLASAVDYGPRRRQPPRSDSASSSSPPPSPPLPIPSPPSAPPSPTSPVSPTPPFAPVAGNKDKVDNATACPKHAADVEPDSDADENGDDGAEEKKLNDGGDEEEDVVAAARADEASDHPAGDGDPDLEKESSLAVEQDADSLESATGSSKPSKVKGGGPLFNPGAHYSWKLCNMVPDIEWGKSIRLLLDIGITDSSFNAALLVKWVVTLSLGLKDDEADLAHVALERGFPAMIAILGTRRLPFPGGVFDSIRCGECRIRWHLSGGKLLLEMNRILRPGGYFILSTERDNIEVEEDM